MTFIALWILGAALGVLGVVLSIGLVALRGFGDQVAGQVACLAGAALFAGSAIYGKRFGQIGTVATSAGTMIWAAVVLVPLALILDQPLTLTTSMAAISATVVLTIVCTGVALLVYFRMLRTLGDMGAAGRSYLRADIDVILGLVFLGETFSLTVTIGRGVALARVTL